MSKKSDHKDEPNTEVNPEEDRKEAEQPTEKQKQQASVKPEKTAGTQAFDRSSQRLTELFDAKDVVFVREGHTTHLTAYPAHEAKTRFAEVKNVESTFGDSKTVSQIELEGGETVTIDGLAVTVQPKKGMPVTDGPDLNAHGINESI